MRTSLLASALALASVACGPPPAPPKSLLDARAAVASDRTGLATQLDPTDVHEAELALDRAERAFRDAPQDPGTQDLALIAHRRALLADAEAKSIKATQDAQAAKTSLDATKTAQLAATQAALQKSESRGEQQSATLAAQQARLAELETKLKDARDTIAKIAAVKDDSRGMVITLQGEVLFTTGKWDLKPGAMAKLDQIAEALKGKEQPIVVYGFTDNVGLRDKNMDLSQKRATSVRDYIVSKGIPQDLVKASGKGPDDAIADNGSVEGRAQNRRVEIVVQPKS